MRLIGILIVESRKCHATVIALHALQGLRERETYIEYNKKDHGDETKLSCEFRFGVGKSSCQTKHACQLGIGIQGVPRYLQPLRPFCCCHVPYWNNIDKGTPHCVSQCAHKYDERDVREED